MWASGQAEAAGELHLFAVAPCDRWKIIVAVHRLLAHMLATNEQEEGDRYGDQRSEQGAKPSVGYHRGPPTIRTHRANACVGSRFLPRALTRPRLNGDIKRAPHGYEPTAQGTKLRVLPRRLG
jgi:hypothetical protein